MYTNAEWRKQSFSSFFRGFTPPTVAWNVQIEVQLSCMTSTTPVEQAPLQPKAVPTAPSAATAPASAERSNRPSQSGGRTPAPAPVEQLVRFTDYWYLSSVLGAGQSRTLALGEFAADNFVPVASIAAHFKRDDLAPPKVHGEVRAGFHLSIPRGPRHPHSPPTPPRHPPQPPATCLR